ncbi:MAG: PolC-type DNA polymerase III [Bradymonadaceae bacterium]
MMISIDSIAFFDVETTGLDPSNSKIIEIGIVVCDDEGDMLCEPWGSLVQRRHVPDEIQELTGISERDLQREGRPWDEVQSKAGAYLYHADAWAAYNADFDIGFVETHIPQLDADRHTVIDPLECVYNYIPPSMIDGRSRSLEDVCQSMGVSLRHAHRAVADTKATKRLMFKMLDRIGMSVQEYVSDRRTRLGEPLQSKDPFEALYISRP